MLNNHPDIVAATEENLSAKFNVGPTLETNIFNKNRPFTDNQIKQKIFLLSQNNSFKIIVEKTPVHIFYVDRQRNIFPKAAIILMERDGRDVVRSIVKVERDPKSWWQGAPDSIETATALWKKYAEESIRCRSTHNPYCIRYENLLSDIHEQLSSLLGILGLSTDYIESQIAACAYGKNIPIKGVFRDGKSGGWKSDFTDDDIRIFKEISGNLLKRLGYETDDSWG